MTDKEWIRRVMESGRISREWAENAFYSAYDHVMGCNFYSFRPKVSNVKAEGAMVFYSFEHKKVEYTYGVLITDLRRNTYFAKLAFVEHVVNFLYRKDLVENNDE